MNKNDGVLIISTKYMNVLFLFFMKIDTNKPEEIDNTFRQNLFTPGKYIRPFDLHTPRHPHPSCVYTQELGLDIVNYSLLST